MKGLEINLMVPDLWQQEAVRALKNGSDVVVHAPTGAGKTYIFELLYSQLKGQAVFTVPTRALANDKLAEWRRRGWDVGLMTGDLTINPKARVIVATLETQKGNFLRRRGPELFVVDEYQMIADSTRGVNYELALALAPRETQLLLLSGSVQNPQDIVAWLQRLGRDALLISHSERPVPLDEVDVLRAGGGGPPVRGFWAHVAASAFQEGLAPLLLFAPRRKASEELAQQIAGGFPERNPLVLSPEQELLAGKRLAKLLRQRVAYHHSGMSYAVRAGLVEPLAKAGQLRAVVATMGLAAGINFSMRSVVVTDTRYFAGNFEREVRQDELLQMFGRAGRRGLDDRGYVLVVPDKPRLHDARPRQLKRATQVDWPSLISVMGGSEKPTPFAEATELARSLFSIQDVPLGVEHSLATGAMPCGLWVDAERARFARRNVTEMETPDGEWELRPPTMEDAALGEISIFVEGRWQPALRIASTLDGVGFGNLCRLSRVNRREYGREIPLGTGEDASMRPVKWLRKKGATGELRREQIEELVRVNAAEWTGGGQVDEFVRSGDLLSARIDYSQLRRPAFIDGRGRALWNPPERTTLPAPCRGCVELPWCQAAEIVRSPAFAWRQLGLVLPEGVPTLRGTIFGFFNKGEGLAIAAAVEEEDYPIDFLVFDLANLRAGPRFAGEGAPLGGRLGALCARVYERADWEGYLEMGVPVTYGDGASEIVRDVVEHGGSKQSHLSEHLRLGDIERAITEWLSLMRHVSTAPPLVHARWMELRRRAGEIAGRVTPPAVAEFPPLLPAQQTRM
jgi:hypothetical protein